MSETEGLAAEPAPPSYREAFQFSGQGGEYFRIWIVNLALSIVTLGLYSPWAKVRRLRYFYGNTQLAGSSFEYHGQPLKILKGRLIALALLIPYYALGWVSPLYQLAALPLLLVAFPFIIVKSRRFTSRMTSWRNVHFDFTGTYGGARARTWVVGRSC